MTPHTWFFDDPSEETGIEMHCERCNLKGSVEPGEFDATDAHPTGCYISDTFPGVKPISAELGYQSFTNEPSRMVSWDSNPLLHDCTDDLSEMLLCHDVLES
jgi:hypothetical protein